MNKYLIVVDMQNDFINGSLGTKEAEAILPNVVKKIENFDGKVIFTYDTHKDDYLDTLEGKNLPVKHCILGTPGWELPEPLEKLRLEKNTLSFSKPTFGSKELAEHLYGENKKEKIDEVELVGLCTDICVISNALLIKAFLPEVNVVVDSACCAGVTPENHQNALRAMEPCQISIK